MVPRSLDNRPVSDTVLHDIGRDLGTSWERLGRCLGIPEKELEAIDVKEHDIGRKGMLMLNMWKETWGEYATGVVLKEALEEIGRPDLLKEGKKEAKIPHCRAAALVTKPAAYAMMERTSLENMPVSFKIFDNLAKNLDTSWKMLGRHLGIPEDELTNIDMENRRVEAKSMAMFNEWQRRTGGEATVSDLQEALRKTGRNDLLEKLEERTYVKHSEIPEGADYTTASGYVMMINNYRFPKRTRYDEKTIKLQRIVFRHLQCLFVSEFGFESREYGNLTKSEMLNILTHTAEKDFSEYDCFVCVILSDGSKDGIFGIDDEMISLEIITSLFTRDKCPSLDGKPKIFLIETFRRRQSDEGPPPIPVVSEDDFLIWYAPLISKPYVHFPTPLFSVAKSLEDHSSEKHLTDILMRVNEEAAESKLPYLPLYLVSTLTKKLFFKSK